MPTRFVPMATTWLNQERFEQAAPERDGNEFCPIDWANTRPLVARYRETHGGQDPPRKTVNGKDGFMLPAEWVAISKERTGHVG